MMCAPLSPPHCVKSAQPNPELLDGAVLLTRGLMLDLPPHANYVS